MDAALEIFLPLEVDTSPLVFKTPMYEWGGINYPQGSAESFFGKNFKLRILDDYNWTTIGLSVPPDLRQIKWKVIAVNGDGLDIYAANLYGLNKEESGFTLKDLLAILLKEELNWLVVFSPQYDGFNKIKKGNIDSVLSDLTHSITKERRGFLIYHYGKERSINKLT